MNNENFEFLNHNRKYLGKGLKIAVLEYYPSTMFHIHDIKNPLNANWRDINGDVEDFNHTYKTSAYWRSEKPLAEIVYLPQNNEGVQYAINNGFHIITFSAMEVRADDSLEKQLATKSFLLSSAGNEYEAQNIECWWAVNELRLDGNELIEPWYHSDFESSKIKSISLSHVQYEEGSQVLDGTSFADVTQGILVADFYEAYQLKFGFYPTIDEVKDFIKDSSKPVLNNVLKEGYGLLVLPDFETYNFGTVIKLNSNEINVNGTIKTTVNPAQIINNKTMVELTVLRECKGNRVYWNDKVKCAVVK